MKKTALLALLLCLLLALSGCGKLMSGLLGNHTAPETTALSTQSPTEVAGEATTEATAEATTEVTTEPITEATTEPTTEATTEPVTEQPSLEPTQTSYLITIADPNFPLWAGPGKQYPYAGTVGVGGVYTIVAEALDVNGGLWGKLKSGAGWVELSLLNSPQTGISVQLTAEYASIGMLNSGNCHSCVADTSEYAVQVAFYTNVQVKNVSLFVLNPAYGYEKGPTVYTLPSWDPGMPIVAQISFPGDMSMYGISVTDSNGAVHNYSVSMSGYDGSIVLSRITQPLS